MKKRYVTTAVLVVGFLLGCKDERLPILGETQIKTKKIDGKVVADTIYHTIPDFAFVNQDSNIVTGKTVEGKVFVADFIFTTCPSICPKMKTQMKRVYDEYFDNEDVIFISHSIDPVHDSVEVLKSYADMVGVRSDRWHFVTGEQEKIFEIGQKSYMVTATKDATEPSGVLHSGAFILVDKHRRIRGIYDGTAKKEVDKLINDMEVLLKES